MVASSCGGGEGEEGVSVGVPAPSGPLQVRISDHGLVRVERSVGVLAAVPVAAGGAERAHSGGLAAGLGGEVAAVAKHVGPAAQGLEVLVRVVPELETGGDQPPLVSARVRVGTGVVGGDPAGRDADRLGGLGGVLSQVGGGGMDFGESITETAMRETREETGITCEITGLVGIYTNPHHVIRYTSNDEVRQEFSIVFTARPISGELRPSSESAEPQWVSRAAASGLRMHPSMRQRIQHYLDKRPEPYLG
jgi:8-oxo-dGTP pyrophosphatase MutT (NUDIX family)